MTGLMSRLRERARNLKLEIGALSLAISDPRVTWLPRLLMLMVIGYALSPIDLIPDFIPVLGLLDDLILVPSGIALVVRLIPPEVLDEYRQRARSGSDEQLKKRGRVTAVVIVLLWLALLAWLVNLAFGLW